MSIADAAKRLASVGAADGKDKEKVSRKQKSGGQYWSSVEVGARKIVNGRGGSLGQDE